MAATIRAVDYFNVTVHDHPGEGYRLLSDLAAAGVSLLAFSAYPIGPESVQLLIFPNHAERLVRAAGRAGVALAGPHRALLVQGDDELGALSHLHRRLFDAGVSVYASNGVTDGRGGYGYVLYVRAEEFEAAARALGVA